MSKITKSFIGIKRNIKTESCLNGIKARVYSSCRQNYHLCRVRFLTDPFFLSINFFSKSKEIQSPRHQYQTPIHHLRCYYIADLSLLLLLTSQASLVKKLYPEKDPKVQLLHYVGKTVTCIGFLILDLISNKDFDVGVRSLKLMGS